MKVRVIGRLAVVVCFTLSCSQFLSANETVDTKIPDVQKSPATPTVQAAQNKSNLIPLSTFYKEPFVKQLQLSPDGTHLLGLKSLGEDTLVMVMNIESGKTFYPTRTDNKQFKINWVSWGNNDRILLSLRFDNSTVYKGKTRVWVETRLIAMDAKKPSQMITLSKPKRDRDADGWISQFQDNIISDLEDDPEHILLAVDRDKPGYQSVYKVNINTGKMQIIKKDSAVAQKWIADRAGNLRIGRHFSYDDEQVTYKVYDQEKDKWIPAWSYSPLKDPEIDIAGFGNNPNEVFLFADYQGRRALYKADLSKPDFPKELVLHDEKRDLSGRLIYSSALKEVVGLYYSGEYSGSVFWNNEYKSFQAGLDKALPDGENFITDLTQDGRKYLVRKANSTNPGTYYFGDRDAKTITEIAKVNAELNESNLTKKKDRTYKARDGIAIEGILTLPKTFNHQPTATIILPHGGPMSAATKNYDMFSAYLTSRGYVVFEPNFRGSTGYGHEFEMQALANMGLAMQDDLEDAVKYLVDEKITDANKVCIVGGSYGGYAALMGVAKTPDLYKCAISFAGLSDLIKMKALYSGASKFIDKQFGDDKKQLKETSPVRLVNKIKAPILLIHGKDDARVPVEQSRIMADALKDAGKPYEYIELPHGTHHLDYVEDRKVTLEAMDVFLQKYLPI